VRTGTVTDRFGEGLLEDGGAGLVVRIRVEAGEAVKRGDQVVILGYDDDRQEFTVAPMEGLMEEREEKSKAQRRE
jgi:acetyl/propionyl-CoA carboxylase alpha subunit